MKHAIRIQALATLGLALSVTAGCAHARTADEYRDDTEGLLRGRQSQVQSCYNAALEQDASAQGVVKVDFTVESETGMIMDPTVDPEGTTAPPALEGCVVNAIQGLALDPGDAKDGIASFTYEFTPRG